MSEEIIEKSIYIETEYELGMECLEKKQYGTAIVHFEKGEADGDGRCTAPLGEAYYSYAQYLGDGDTLLHKNDAERLELYRKAAEHGYAPAQYMYSACLHSGMLGCECDPTKAFEWCKRAAENGCANAQFELADVYYKFGIAVGKSKAAIVRWLERSAAQGNVEAMYALGERYYEGDGVEQDYGKALELFKKLVDKNDDNGLYMLGKCYFNGYGVKKDRNKADKCFFDVVHRNRDYSSNREAAFYLAICRIESALHSIQYQAERDIKDALDYLCFALDGKYGRRAKSAYSRLKKQREYKDFDKEYWRKWCEKQT